MLSIKCTYIGCNLVEFLISCYNCTGSLWITSLFICASAQLWVQIVWEGSHGVGANHVLHLLCQIVQWVLGRHINVMWGLFGWLNDLKLRLLLLMLTWHFLVFLQLLLLLLVEVLVNTVYDVYAIVVIRVRYDWGGLNSWFVGRGEEYGGVCWRGFVISFFTWAGFSIRN